MKKKFNYLLIFMISILLIDNAYALEYVSCGYGSDIVDGIPAFVPRLTSLFVTLLQILIPLVLIITGMIEMTKTVSAGNPDNVAKGKTKLIKKFLAASFAFLIISFTTNILKLVATKTERGSFIACMSCYLNNDCNPVYQQNSEYGDGYTDESEVNGKYCYQYPIEHCNGKTDPDGNQCVVRESGCVAITNNNNGNSSGNNTLSKYCYQYELDECNGKTDPDGNRCAVRDGQCKTLITD